MAWYQNLFRSQPKGLANEALCRKRQMCGGLVQFHIAVSQPIVLLWHPPGHPSRGCSTPWDLSSQLLVRQASTAQIRSSGPLRILHTRELPLTPTSSSGNSGFCSHGKNLQGPHHTNRGTIQPAEMPERKARSDGNEMKG